MPHQQSDGASLIPRPPPFATAHNNVSDAKSKGIRCHSASPSSSQQQQQQQEARATETSSSAAIAAAAAASTTSAKSQRSRVPFRNPDEQIRHMLNTHLSTLRGIFKRVDSTRSGSAPLALLRSEIIKNLYLDDAMYHFGNAVGPSSSGCGVHRPTSDRNKITTGSNVNAAKPFTVSSKAATTTTGTPQRSRGAEGVCHTPVLGRVSEAAARHNPGIKHDYKPPVRSPRGLSDFYSRGKDGATAKNAMDQSHSTSSRTSQKCSQHSTMTADRRLTALVNALDQVMNESNPARTKFIEFGRLVRVIRSSAAAAATARTAASNSNEAAEEEEATAIAAQRESTLANPPSVFYRPPPGQSNVDPLRAAYADEWKREHTRVTPSDREIRGRFQGVRMNDRIFERRIASPRTLGDMPPAQKSANILGDSKLRIPWAMLGDENAMEHVITHVHNEKLNDLKKILEVHAAKGPAAAVGSSSSAGRGSSCRQLSYPQLLAALRTYDPFIHDAEVLQYFSTIVGDRERQQIEEQQHRHVHGTRDATERAYARHGREVIDRRPLTARQTPLPATLSGRASSPARNSPRGEAASHQRKQRGGRGATPDGPPQLSTLASLNAHGGDDADATKRTKPRPPSTGRKRTGVGQSVVDMGVSIGTGITATISVDDFFTRFGDNVLTNPGMRNSAQFTLKWDGLKRPLVHRPKSARY